MREYLRRKPWGSNDAENVLIVLLVRGEISMSTKRSEKGIAYIPDSIMVKDGSREQTPDFRK